MDNNRFLFRGKRLDNGGWIYGNLCSDGNRCYIVYDNDFYESEEHWLNVLHADRYYEVSPITVGQSTGLYAEKSYRGESVDDRMIFEGDVMCHPNVEGQEDIVFWHIRNASWGVISRGMYPYRNSGEVLSNGIPLCQDVSLGYEIRCTIFDE